MRKLICCTILALFSSAAIAGFPPGSPEHKAEMEGLAKAREAFSKYTISASNVAMRSNRQSIAIPAYLNGKRRDLKSLVTRQNRRDGTYFYNVGAPVWAASE